MSDCDAGISGVMLGYTDYRNFEAVIEKARTACVNSGQRVEDHFVEITEMAEIGSGAQQGGFGPFREQQLYHGCQSMIDFGFVFV